MLRRRRRETDEPTQQKPLRLWPGVIAVVLQWLVRFVLLMVLPEALIIAVFGGLVGALVIIVWWAFFSRAPRSERWKAVVLMVVALIGTWLLVDKSMRLMPFVGHIIPALSLAFVFWAVVCRRLSDGPRRVATIAILLIACGTWALVRSDGITGSADVDFAWRWAETHEDRFLAQASDESMTLQSALMVAETEADWPGFRGPNRDSIIHGIQIETDWAASPPVELWRRLVGPGWSSFAVRGDLFYTQEQHGDDEVVTCYKVSTGEPVWKHQDPVRFWESNAGAGPRSTPTLSGNRIYALGATGILNVLNATDGDVIWSRDVASDTETKVPTWGFSSSPLVLDEVVIVAAAGSLIAYDLANGEPRWSNIAGGDCYSSPHLLRIDGIAQVLLSNDAGTSSVTLTDGALLWEHPWSGHPIVQPALIDDGDLLISADERTGIRRIEVARGPDGWTVTEHWTSTRLRPYFNDSVVHEGHAYGFDGRSVACIDVEDGKRQWKGGRYGRGQLVLLADQDLLLVLSEKGVLALVEAIPDQFTELAQFPAIEGKTWNHPVLIGDTLLVRNGQEMAAFRLSLAQI